MVVGCGFVVARAAAVLVDPRETSLDHPNAGPDVETSGAREAFDDLQSKGENVFGPDEQPSGVTAVGPDQPDGGEARAQPPPLRGADGQGSEGHWSMASA